MSWQSPPSEHDQLAHLVEVEIPRLERHIERLRDALEWIECEPEDAHKVQQRARSALIFTPSHGARSATPDSACDGSGGVVV